MLVYEAMNPIIVTVGPDHSLREAARRMTERQVGAAVVLDDEQGPGIITERDLLRSNGRGEDIDQELVRDHQAEHLIYAYADWPLQRAAETMTKGGFRHVVVLKDGAPAGILSMRDIVRFWLEAGAVQAGAAR
jgi:CBS domain-containing protein